MDNLIVFSKKRILGYLIISLSVVFYYLLPTSISLTAARSLSLFLCVAAFWAFEIIPLFATSIGLVVALTLFLNPTILGIEGVSPALFFNEFANPVIFLFFGGFVLAKALNKHHVDQYIARQLFSRIGTKSFSLLSGHLFLTAFLSMWISNTAAAVIMLSLISPLIAELPTKDPLTRGLPLAVAFGASIGGIITPIGTPPNALAIGILSEQGIKISFLSWMGMAMPLAILILGVTALILWFLFSSKITIQSRARSYEPLTKQAKGVVFGAIIMISLWLTSPFHQLSEALVALIGVGYFSFFGLIETNDLKNLEWDILFLMWGGLALGEAMAASNLVPSIIGGNSFADMGVWVYVGFGLLAMILSSFMSNTATANLLLPIVVALSLDNRFLFSIAIALCCSLTLTFPIATPPNALAYSLNTFTTKDMFKAGFMISAIALIVILLGFDLVIPLFL